MPQPTSTNAAQPPSPFGGTGAGLGGLSFSDAPIMLGDQAPPTIRALFPPPVPQPPPSPTPPIPPIPPVPGGGGNVPPRRGRIVIAAPWIRGFKIAENQSPRPLDRFFFTYNYFDNIGQEINRSLGAPLHHVQIQRYQFGLEKTFLGGNASFGFRLPLNYITADSRVRGFGGADTAVGSLAIFTKFILWQDRASGSLISGGLAVTTPTGPTSFAGARYAAGFRNTQLQPYLGYLWTRGRFYFQGFEAIDVPTDPNDVTMLYNDTGIGYVVYRSADRRALLTSIAPTFEVHANIPLNHRGATRPFDPAGTPDIVDFTYGVNFYSSNRGVLSVAFVNPVTGPRPFDFEWTALLSIYYGRTRRLGQATPPVIGQ